MTEEEEFEFRARLESEQAAPEKKPVGSVLSRAMSGLADPIHGAAQIADRYLVDPIRQRISPGASSMQDVTRQRDAEYSAPEGVDWARMAGNVANPMTWAGGGTSGALNAARMGALQGGLSPVQADQNFEETKALQTGGGAVLGGVLSKMLRGATATPDAQKLMDQGIQPTIGQAKGGGLNRFEQRITSLPFVGDVVQNARVRPLKEFDKLAISRVTNGAADTLDDANAHASALYNEVVPHLKPTKEAVAGIQQALRDAMNNPEMIDQNKAILTGLVKKHGQNFGALSGEGLKKLDSELGYLARKYQAGDPASKTLADEIYNVQQAFRTGLEPGLPPELQGKLQAANTVWKDLIPVNKAASARTDEKVTPRALQKAIARQQRTDTSRMRPDELIDPAVAVLPQSVPDSGTAGRLLLGGLGSGAIGMLPQYLAAAALGTAAASRPAQAALLGNTRVQRALSPHDTALTSTIMAALRSQQGQE